MLRKSGKSLLLLAALITGGVFLNGKAISAAILSPSKAWLAKDSLAFVALLGDRNAAHMLASIELFHSTDPREQAKGFARLKHEYEKNHSCYAAGKLGWAYQKGITVSKDADLALKLYEHAASCGMTYWQILLAHAYKHGYLGLAKSDEKSIYWKNKTPKVHSAVHECWVYFYYVDNIYPENAELKEKNKKICEARKSS